MITEAQQIRASLVKAITNIAATMPLARTMQLYQFACFLQTDSPLGETLAEVAVDEALWDNQFAMTSDDNLAALIATIEAEINEGKTLPMFNERGEFAEHQ